MKKFAAKKVFALLAAGVMTVGGLAGCGEKQTGLEDFKNRPNKVSVVYNANAYGKEWITQIAREYMTNYNQDTYIYLEQTVTPIEEASKIQSDSASADLYLFDHHLEDLEYNVEKLEDVWDSYPVGEDGQVKIKDKLSPLLKSMKEKSTVNVRRVLLKVR